jgi:H/ACA ribonucleoprotein complex non-core subunit NAF1
LLQFSYLELIAKLLLEEEDQMAGDAAMQASPVTAESVVEVLAKGKVASGSVSMQNYLNRKRDLNRMTNGTDEQSTSSSSEEDSDSSSSSSSSSDDSSSDEEEENEKAQVEKTAVEEEEDDEEGPSGAAATQIPRTKHEADQLPPVQPPPIVQLPPEHRMIEVGTVFGVVHDLVIVQSNQLSGENLALDAGSILIHHDRQVLGEIFETFGPVDRPMYSVRFNAASDIDQKRVVKGQPIFQCPEYSKMVFVAALRALKGTDASNLFDEELPAEEQEYSDDEQEQAAKRKRKNRGGNGAADSGPSAVLATQHTRQSLTTAAAAAAVNRTNANANNTTQYAAARQRSQQAPLNYYGTGAAVGQQRPFQSQPFRHLQQQHYVTPQHQYPVYNMPLPAQPPPMMMMPQQQQHYGYPQGHNYPIYGAPMYGAPMNAAHFQQQQQQQQQQQFQYYNNNNYMQQQYAAAVPLPPQQSPAQPETLQSPEAIAKPNQLLSQIYSLMSSNNNNNNNNNNSQQQ